MHQIFACMLTLCSWLNVLPYMRGIRSTAPLVMMLVEICKDVLPFMLILLIVLIGFGIVFWILLQPAQGFESLYDAFFSTFLWGVLGEFDVVVLQSSDSPQFVRMIFVVFVMLLLVICLNLLIALLGSSHERVMDSFDVTFRSERAKLVAIQLGLISLFAPSLLKRIERETVWFHQVCPEALKGKADESNWAGQLHEIRRITTASQKSLTEHFSEDLEAKLEAKLEALSAKMLDQLPEKLLQQSAPKTG